MRTSSDKPTRSTIPVLHPRKLTAFMLACAFLFSVIAWALPAVAEEPEKPAVSRDNPEETEIMEEVPFTFPLEEGDISPEKLKDRKLDVQDIPSYLVTDEKMSFHVNRLRAQEPDDRTVIFQNIDGSKTVYYFSAPVKAEGVDLSPEEVLNAAQNPEAAPSILYADGKVQIPQVNSVLSRLWSSEAEHPVRDYSIGFAELVRIAPNGEEHHTEITEGLRAVAGSEACEALEVAVEPDDGALVQGEGLLYVAYITTPLSGLFALKNAVTNKYLTAVNHSLMGMSNIHSLQSRWIFTYQTSGYVYGSYLLRVLRYQMVDYFLSINSIYDDIELSYIYGLRASWVLDFYSDNSVTIASLSDEYCLIDSTPGIDYRDEFTYPSDCEWILTNSEEFTPLLAIYPQGDNYVFVGQDLTSLAQPYPAAPTAYSWEWYDVDTGEVLSDDNSGNVIDAIGTYRIRCRDEYTGMWSPVITVNVAEYAFFGTQTNKTYAIRPYYSSNSTFYENYLTMGGATTGNNTVSVEEYYHPTTLTTFSAKWTDKSQTFTIDRIGSTNTHKIASTLCADQYTANGNGVPTYNNNKSQYNNADWNNYTMIYQTDVPNYLCGASGVSGKMSTYTGTDWVILKVGYVTYGTVTVPKYVILRNLSLSEGRIDGTALKHSASSSGAQTVGTGYLYGETSEYEWTIEQIGINCPLIKQTNTEYCGFATMLQIFYGAQTGQNVPTYSSPNCLAGQMLRLTSWQYLGIVNGCMFQGGSQDSSGNSSGVCYRLNHIISTNVFDSVNYNYHRTTGQTNAEMKANSDTSTLDDFVGVIQNSLNIGWAPFMLTSTGGPPYRYAGQGQIGQETDNAHYICISGYDAVSQCVILSNCHYWDATGGAAVYGIYAVSVDSVYNNTKTLFYSVEK